MPRAIFAFLLVLVLAVAAPDARAQDRFSGAFLVNVGVPQGAFADQIDAGIGLGGTLLFHIPNAPVALGLDGGFLIYGQERIRTPFGSGPLGRVDVDVVTTNNIVTGHLLLRLGPNHGTFRPYADALFGVNYLFTESRIEDVDRSDSRDYSSTNFDDAALSYGIGGGVQVDLYRGRSGEAGRPFAIALDARVRYLFGSEARYLKKGGIVEENGGLVYVYDESRTDMLLPQLGVVFRF